MSSSVEDLIVVQTINSIETGQVVERIPPHMTVLSWFALSRLHIAELSEQMDSLALRYGQAARVAVGRERVKYGIKEDIPACTVSVATDAIHVGLREFADAHGAEYHYEQYAKNWSPHITDEPGLSIQPEDEVNFSSLVLFSRQETESGAQKTVEHSVPLIEG
jgi:2'-5' RNA ligase